MSEGKSAMRAAAVIATVAVLLDLAFWFLSRLYFDDRRLPGDVFDTTGLEHARIGFVTLTTQIAIGAFASIVSPRVVGHALAAVLLVSGALMPILAWRSWHRVRAAWAFLIALVAVCGGVDFFGASKVRGVLGIGLWTAFNFPALQFVAVAALARIRDQYREPTALADQPR
jgi:hypothetical protein